MALTKAHNRMITGAPVNVLDFGAVGNGDANDQPKIQAAIDSCVTSNKKLYAPSGFTFKIDSALNFSGVNDIEFLSNILVNPAISGVPVVVGGFATSGIANIRFADVTDGTSLISAPAPSRPIFRISGMKSGVLNIGSCNYLQLYADDSSALTNSTAYNDIYLSGAQRKVEIKDAGGTQSWITENRIHGGRIIELNIQGVSYKHNHNKFYNNTFEGSSVKISFVNCNTNFVYGARLEGTSGSTGISFDANTFNNYLTQTWSGVGNPRNAYTIDTPITNSGQNNIVTTEHLIGCEKVTLFNITPNSGVVSTGSDSSAFGSQVTSIHHPPFHKGLITPSLKKMSASTNDVLGLSGFIPVEFGDVFGFNVKSPTTAWRPYVYIYDANMKPITSEGGAGAYINMINASLLTNNGRGYYGPSTNLTSAQVSDFPAAVVRTEVKYIQLAMISVAASTFEEVSAFFYCQKRNRDAVQGAQRFSRMPSINGVVTKGYVPQDTSILNTATSPASIRYVSYSNETFANGAVVAGATSITVVDIDAVANGDLVGILLDDGTTHWTAVSSLSTATFTIAAIPTGRSVADKSLVVFNRWTT
tara:strand:+ start:50 stop:1813 length:1764 start_codon:yes stop_codon:yes gene_type:complete